eukprot:jgi/Astpho2/7179/Aster-x0759
MAAPEHEISAVLRPVSSEGFLKTQHLKHYFCDLCKLYLTSDGTQPAADFALEYFQAVQAGTHVIGRRFEIVAATPHNRRCFLRLAWQAFAPLARADMDELTLHDLHSLLQLVCADCPQRVGKSAFKAAMPLSNQGQLPRLPLEAMWLSLEVTFLYEKDCMQSAAKQLKDGSFHFDGLVRVLCSSPVMKKVLREEDTAFQQQQQHTLRMQGRQAKPEPAQPAALSALDRPRQEEIVAVVVS